MADNEKYFDKWKSLVRVRTVVHCLGKVKVGWVHTENKDSITAREENNKKINRISIR